MKKKDEEETCFFGLWMKFDLPFQRNKFDILMNKLDLNKMFGEKNVLEKTKNKIK